MPCGLLLSGLSRKVQLFAGPRETPTAAVSLPGALPSVGWKVTPTLQKTSTRARAAPPPEEKCIKQLKLKT
ncbi:Eukaryotic Translation Initiation Factor 2 Subunit 3B [Manis pentadactyla]|nr:Eukaryotic Translation Initiation Factor 2 Subunit 3B [Manis pentadactyla]